jgi:ribosomal protein S18 acetylase RimI-like enzyme
MTLTYADLRSLADERYDAYLDIYQRSFPLGEQMLVSGLNRTLRGIESGEDTESRMIVALEPDGQVVAMAHFEMGSAERAAALWYLAVAPELRCAGLGSAVYRHIVGALAQGSEPAVALVFEVERPDRAHDDAQGVLADRRIAFYRRQGALLLTGVDYIQSVGWQPPVEMHVMVHPFRGMTPDEAFVLARAVLGDAVESIGPLALE